MSDDVNPYNAGPPTSPQHDLPPPPVPSAMSFEYEQNVDDLVEFSLHLLRRPRNRLRRWFFVALIFGVWLVAAWELCSQIALGQPAQLQLQIVVVLLGIILVGKIPPVARARLKTSCRKLNRNILPLRVLVAIGPEGIRTATSTSDERRLWGAFERLDVDNSCAYLHSSDFQAIIIPSRAFASGAHFQAFVESARQFWQAAR